MSDYSFSHATDQAKNSPVDSRRKASPHKQRFPYFKFYPRDWLEATRHMSLEERGAYFDIICLIMEGEGDLADDERRIAHQMHISTRKWRSVRGRLVEHGKIRIQDGLIIQERCLRELDSLLVQRRSSAESALNRERSKRENREKVNKNNDSDTTIVPLRARVTSDLDLDKKESPPSPQGEGARQGALFDDPPERQGSGRSAVAAVAAAIVAATALPAAAAPLEPVPIEQPSKPSMTDQARALYEAVAERRGLPAVRVFNEARRKALAARLREAGGLDGFRRAMDTLDRASFLHGRNDRGWRADFDFVLQPKSFSKLVEGSYRKDLPASAGGVSGVGGDDFRHAKATYGPSQLPAPPLQRWLEENRIRKELGEPLMRRPAELRGVSVNPVLLVGVPGELEDA